MRIRTGFCGVAFAAAALALAAGSAEAQLRTMNKDCKARVAAASQLNDAGDYSAALAAYDAIVKKCDSKDGKEAVQVGRARALNGQGHHAEAIAAADAALAATKGASLFAYFEKAYAEEKVGNAEAATADYHRIIELTEKNQNVTERATIYAKVADMHDRAGKSAEAESSLAKAIELDPGNADFVIMQGDWKVRAGDYDGAFAAYDKAVVMGRTDLEMYQIRAEARMKQMQEKYDTTNAQELRGKMNPTETGQVCVELTKALDLGLKDMKLDMFAALICK